MFRAAEYASLVDGKKGAALAAIGDKWYLLQLKPNAHQVALRNLQRQGFHTFLPLQEVTLRRAERFIEKRRPLFPGYMFVGFDPDAAPWRKINSTLGVAKLVSFSEQPRAVPNDLIAGLMQRCDSHGIICEPEQLEIGDSVQLLSGAFANFIARIEHIDEAQRVWMLIDIMGQTTRLSARHDQLKVSRL